VKAINWPAPFRDEVLSESTEPIFSAFRLGRLYFDNQYWAEGETIHIRVNHKIIRLAVIKGDLKCTPIQALSPADFAAQKTGLKDVDSVVRFLSETYQKPVTPETEVTVVYYRNLPIDPDIVEKEDDTHMM
jgi:hypothetical protein